MAMRTHDFACVPTGCSHHSATALHTGRAGELVFEILFLAIPPFFQADTPRLFRAKQVEEVAVGNVLPFLDFIRIHFVLFKRFPANRYQTRRQFLRLLFPKFLRRFPLAVFREPFHQCRHFLFLRVLSESN